MDQTDHLELQRWPMLGMRCVELHQLPSMHHRKLPANQKSIMSTHFIISVDEYEQTFAMSVTTTTSNLSP